LRIYLIFIGHASTPRRTERTVAAGGIDLMNPRPWLLPLLLLAAAFATAADVPRERTPLAPAEKIVIDPHPLPADAEPDRNGVPELERW
jgi:hypothetical protein